MSVSIGCEGGRSGENTLFVVLYYYDRMFTLCYMLHLLFTRQDVHDLKLHITEQENVHFEPKLLVGRLDRWLTESPVVRLGGRQSTY